MSLKTLITMRRYTYALIIITSIILGSTIINNASAYVIDHNNHSVWVQGNYGKLEATPHTITQSGWVYFNITPYQDIGNIDMVWGFNTTEVKPKKAEFYKPHWINWTTDHERFFWNVSKIESTSDDCCYGNSYNTYKRKITYQTGYNNVTNESITTTKTVCFDSYTHNGSNYTAYWHTDHSRLENWIDVSNKFHSINYNYDNKTKWWYVTNFAVESYKTYTGRVWIDVPVTLDGVSGKYDFAVKRSSDSLHDAINNHRFYLLDPWFNSSWSTKRNLHINWNVTSNPIELNNPTEDGYIYNGTGSGGGYVRTDASDDIYSYVYNASEEKIYRGYFEWDVSSIPDDAVITNVTFKYHGHSNNGDAHINQMGCQPSTSSSEDVYNDIGGGTTYINQDGFPEVGENKEINLGSNAVSDLQNALSSNWFAIGIQEDETIDGKYSIIYSEDYASANPKPTLYIEYVMSLNYYQMNLNLSYSDIPEAQPDFDDIRFVNISDGTSLPYWIEDKVDGEWCNVWVNITSLHDGWNNNTVALYYGNEGASSVSDGDTTFLQYHGDTTATYKDDNIIINNYVFESKVKITSDIHHWQPGVANTAAHDDDWMIFDIYNEQGVTGYVANENTNSNTGHISPAWVSDEWHNLKCEMSTTDAKFYKDNVQMGSALTTNLPDETSGLSLRSLSGTCEQAFAFIRKYAANPPTYEFGIAHYLAGSIHYNTTSPYNHTIESDGTTTANRSIITTDDIKWTASAVSDDCGLLVTQFNLSNNTIANFTVYNADLDWLRVTNLTVGRRYYLKNSSGIVESHSVDASGEINYTTDLIPGSYWITLILPAPAIIDTNYTILGNDALIIFSSTNTLVTFTATSNQTISHWYWTNATYMDGNGTASSNASHYYGVNGTYYVTVRGEDPAGTFTDTITWQINVGSTDGGTGGGTANGTYALIGTAIPLGARKTTMASAFVLLSGMFMMMLAKRYKEDEQDVT